MNLMLNAIILAMSLTARASAQDKTSTSSIDALRTPRAAVQAATPIFGQVVRFSVSKGFMPGLENTAGLCASVEGATVH